MSTVSSGSCSTPTPPTCSASETDWMSELTTRSTSSTSRRTSRTIIRAIRPPCSRATSSLSLTRCPSSAVRAERRSFRVTSIGRRWHGRRTRGRRARSRAKSASTGVPLTTSRCSPSGRASTTRRWRTRCSAITASRIWIFIPSPGTASKSVSTGRSSTSSMST